MSIFTRGAGRVSPAFFTVMLATLLLSGAHSADAATPEQLCIKGRHLAIAKYESCYEKTIGQAAGGAIEYGGPFQDALARCRAKLAATWPRLQTRYPGTTCSGPRFSIGGDGTVTDRLTGLQWEQKTDDGSAHDKDTLYNYSADGPNGVAANGTEFTSFLAALNGGGCFATHCDWRLPSAAELGTTLSSECTNNLCIDESVFGPTMPFSYQTATTQLDPGFPSDETFAWVVRVDIAWTLASFKGGNVFARAVRSRLM